MSNLARSRSSVSGDATSIVILPALSDFFYGNPAPSPQAGRRAAKALPAIGSDTSGFSNHRFLIATNERFSLNPKFVTRTKKSTSLFLIATNERSHITTQRSLLTTHQFLIAGEEILIPTLTPAVPTPSGFLIAGVCPLFAVRAASARATRFSARSSAFGSSAHIGMHPPRHTNHDSQVTNHDTWLTHRDSPITTHLSLTRAKTP